jgi:predicted metal-binding membrane protein|tara:strand:+ start:1769 stop:2173 length:405 start_codon:yes stop_codon:yes gene_type:complete
MTEMEIINQFNVFMISNSIYLAAGFFILWVAFRMVVNIQSDPSSPMLNKVLATLFGLGSVYYLLQINGFLYSNWQGTVNQLAEIDNLTSEGQQFVDLVGVGDASFSLIPADPIFAVWYLVILGIILGGIWMKRS